MSQSESDLYQYSNVTPYCSQSKQFHNFQERSSVQNQQCNQNERNIMDNHGSSQVKQMMVISETYSYDRQKIEQIKLNCTISEKQINHQKINQKRRNVNPYQSNNILPFMRNKHFEFLEFKAVDYQHIPIMKNIIQKKQFSNEIKKSKTVQTINQASTQPFLSQNKNDELYLRPTKQKGGITLSDFLQMYACLHLRELWGQMFESKYLYRALIKSKASLKQKKYYLRKINKFRNAFLTGKFQKLCQDIYI